MFKNKNINNRIFDYLKAVELARVEQVNKKLNSNCKAFNNKWKDECEAYFLHLSEILPLNTDDNVYLEEIRDKICRSSIYDYKKIFEKGIKTFNSWGEKVEKPIKKHKNTDEILNFRINRSSNSDSKENSIKEKDSKNFKAILNSKSHEEKIKEDFHNMRKEVFNAFKCK